MTMRPERPERLAEILLEILALSGSKRKSESESGSDQSELFDAHGFPGRNQSDNNEQMP
jgi:hypothetical protein